MDSMRRDFVANLSHELRTPVSVIRANSETLLDGALDNTKDAMKVGLSAITPGLTVAKNEGYKTVISIRGVGDETNQKGHDSILPAILKPSCPEL